MPREVEFNGRRIQVPDDATDAEVAGILGGELGGDAPEAPAPAPEPLSPERAAAARGLMETAARNAPAFKAGMDRARRGQEQADRDRLVWDAHELSRELGQTEVFSGPADAAEYLQSVAAHTRDWTADNPVKARLLRVASSLVGGVTAGHADAVVGKPAVKAAEMVGAEQRRTDDSAVAQFLTEDVPGVAGMLLPVGAGSKALQAAGLGRAAAPLTMAAYGGASGGVEGAVQMGTMGAVASPLTKFFGGGAGAGFFKNLAAEGASNVAGGMVGRTVVGQEPFDPAGMGKDAIFGLGMYLIRSPQAFREWREARAQTRAEEAFKARVDAVVEEGFRRNPSLIPQEYAKAPDGRPALPEPVQHETPEGPAIPLPERVSYTDAEELAAIRSSIDEQRALGSRIEALEGDPEIARGLARAGVPEVTEAVPEAPPEQPVEAANEPVPAGRARMPQEATLPGDGPAVDPAPDPAPEPARAAPEAPAEAGPKPESLVGDPEAGYLGLGRAAGAAAEPVTRAGKFLGGFGRQVAGWLRNPFGEVVGKFRGKAGPVGDALYSDAFRAAEIADAYVGKNAGPLRAFLKTVQGGLGGKKARLARDLQKPEGGGSSWRSFRGRELLEGRVQPGGADEAGVTESGQRLLGSTWDTQADMGLTRVNREGVREPMRRLRDGKGKVLPYHMNDDFSDAVVTGESHPLYKPIRTALAEMNGWDEAKATKWLKERRVAMEGMSPDAAQGHMASEFSRGVLLPSYVNYRGQWVPVETTNLFKVGRGLVERGAYVVGARKVFETEKGESLIGKRRAEFVDKGGNDADFVQAMRAVYGLNPNGPSSGRPAYGTPGRAFADAYGVIAGADRAGALTVSPVYNAPEMLMGKPADRYGVVRSAAAHAESLWDAVQGMVTGKHTKGVQKAIDQGLYHEGLADWTLDAGGSAIGNGLRTFAHLVRNTLSTPVNKMQSKAAALLASRESGHLFPLTAGSVRAEQFVQRVRAYAGLSMDDTRAFLEGTLPPEQTAEIAQRIVTLGAKYATGDGLHPAQKGLYEQSIYARTLSRFITWAANHTRVIGNRIAGIAEGYTSAMTEGGLTPAERANRATAASLEAGRLLTITALSQASIRWLSLLVLGTEEEREKAKEKFEADPASALAGEAFWGLLAGPWAGFARGAIEGGRWTDIAHPLKVARNVGQAAVGAVRAVQGKPGQVVESAGDWLPAIEAFGDTDELLKEEQADERREERRGLGRRRRR